MYTKSIHHFFLLSQILLDVYLMYTKNVHHGNVIHTVYTICLQKVYYQCSNFGKGIPRSSRNQSGIFLSRKDPNNHKQWLQKIRTDVGPNFSLTKATQVCSLHFHGEKNKNRHFRQKMELVKGTIPSRLVWHTCPRNRHPPLYVLM